MKWPKGAFANSLSEKFTISPLSVVAKNLQNCYRTRDDDEDDARNMPPRLYPPCGICIQSRDRLMRLVSLIYTSILVFNLPLLHETRVSHLFGLYAFWFCALHHPLHTHWRILYNYIHMYYMITILNLYGVVIKMGFNDLSATVLLLKKKFVQIEWYYPICK